MSDPSQAVVADTKPEVLELAPGKYFWCACGRSASQKFCDGSHKGTGFTPIAFEVAETKTVAICNCKHTQNPPFCDGSHTKLSVS
ncbi:MAG TPA: CDGSH iron-sulfur domain-containing protein [Coleofasciculaceae cyanobacterium]